MDESLRTEATLAGTATFLFTDIERSTEMWERYRAVMPNALERHDAVMRDVIAACNGRVFKEVGDAFHAVFADPARAIMSAIAIQRSLKAEAWETPEPIRVRIALHAGDAQERDGDFFGPTLNRTARILAAGHGGQILLSQAVERLVEDRFPEGAALRDMGERRLKDLDRPVRIFQLVADGLDDEFPPLRTLDVRPHNLPAQPSPLVGRERELKAVRDLVLRDSARLVTLTGPGGTGKTRLALQVAAEVIDAYRDGVFFVNLTTVREPERLASVILQALDVMPDSGESPDSALRKWLVDRQVLLILDNFEQIVDSAPRIGALLQDAPRLTLLVTSQAALRIGGEHAYPLGPLAVPSSKESDPDLVAGNEAVGLFVERAQAIRPDFQLDSENAADVVSIVRQLDGLPLAIELAATRIQLFTPKALLQRLEQRFDFLSTRARDVPDRHRTLRNAIAWSYDLLDEDEKALFRRQATFDGGFTLDSAEYVCSPPDDPLDVLEGLSSLIDKSLLRQRPTDSGEPQVRAAADRARLRGRVSGGERRGGPLAQATRRALRVSIGSGGRVERHAAGREGAARSPGPRGRQPAGGAQVGDLARRGGSRGATLRIAAAALVPYRHAGRREGMAGAGARHGYQAVRPGARPSAEPAREDSPDRGRQQSRGRRRLRGEPGDLSSARRPEGHSPGAHEPRQSQASDPRVRRRRADVPGSAGDLPRARRGVRSRRRAAEPGRSLQRARGSR